MILRMLRERPELNDELLKILVPTHLGRFDGPLPGHRAIHLAGDLRLGVGLLATRPRPTVADLRSAGLSWSEVRSYPYIEASYAAQGDFVVYAAPNEFTNPYVIGARRAASAQRLGRTYRERARVILSSVRRARVEDLRARLPFVACARCDKPARWFMVPPDDWARVGPEWLKKVLCPECYAELTGAAIP